MRQFWEKGVTDGHTDPQTDGWTKLNSNICESLFPVVKRSFHTFRCISSFHSKKRKIWNKYLYIISYIFYLISFFVFSLNINSIRQSHMITNIPSYHGKRLITSEERATRQYCHRFFACKIVWQYDNDRTTILNKSTNSWSQNSCMVSCTSPHPPFFVSLQLTKPILTSAPPLFTEKIPWKALHVKHSQVNIPHLLRVP